jgi:SAM-dependent methyltransferase
LSALGAPSALFESERERLTRAAALGPVVDLACGRGRHTLAAAELGARALGFDRDAVALAQLRDAARSRRLDLLAVRADLEGGLEIPAKPASCGAVLVFRFLFRPLAPAICQALKPGGLLLYETFTAEQRALGRGPRNPAFLLAPGELPDLFRELRVLHSWEGLTTGENPEAVARLVAQKP